MIIEIRTNADRETAKTQLYVEIEESLGSTELNRLFMSLCYEIGRTIDSWHENEEKEKQESKDNG
jgi:hypothetical protein